MIFERRGARLLAAALSLTFVATSLACHGSEEGLSVRLTVAHAGPAGTTPTAGAPRILDTDLGHHVTLTRAFVTVGSVELVTCDSAVAVRLMPTPRRSLWSTLAAALNPVGVAHAHEPAATNLFGAPWVEAILAADGAAAEIGSLEVTPNAFCQVHVTFGPADADAHNLPADPDMVGKAAYLEGTHRPTAGGASTPFVIDTPTGSVAKMILPAALELDDDQRGATVAIQVSYAGWFEGLDFPSLSSTELRDAWLTRLAAGTSVTATLVASE